MRFKVTDQSSGDTLVIEADKAPTQDDVAEIFSSRESSNRQPTTQTPEQQYPNLRMNPYSEMNARGEHVAFPSEPGSIQEGLGMGAALLAAPVGLAEVGGAAILNTPEYIRRKITGDKPKVTDFSGSETVTTEKPYPFQPGQSLLPEPEPGIGGINNPDTVGQFIIDTARGLTTPGMVLAAPFGASKAVQAAFISQTIPGAITETAAALNPNATPDERLKAALGAGLNAAFSIGLGKSLASKTAPIADIVSKADEIAPIAPLTAEALKATAKTTEVPNASSVPEAAEVHGSLQPQPVQGQGEVPTSQGGGGIQPQAERGLSEGNEPIQVEPQPPAGEVRDWQVTVQSPSKLSEDITVPGYVQIDDIAGGKNNWSKSPETLAKEGVKVPDFSNLPQGKYSYEEALKLTKEHGATAEEIKTEPSPSPADLVGMGAAVPSEFVTSPKTPTSIKNAQVDVERQSRGLPPAVEPAKRSFGEVWDKAMALIDHDPGYQDRLLGELRDKPRALTDLEDAAILHRQIDLQNEYGKATRDLAQAFDDGRTDAVELEKARVAALSDQLLDIYEIGKKVGTETGRGLNARKMMAMEDFSLAKMELESRASKGGRQLTDAERDEVVALNKKIQDTQKAFDDYVANTDRELAARDMQQALDEMQKDLPKTKAKPTPKDALGIEEKIQNKTDAIKLKINEGERSDIGSLVQQLARLLVERGIKERDPLIDAVHTVLKSIDPKFTRRETMDAISGYGQFRQLTKDEISLKLRDLKGQMQQVAKLEDMQANKPPLKTGMERRVPSTEESRLIRLVNEAKNQFQIPITDEATQIKSSLDMLKSRLKHKTAEWEDRLKRGDFAKKPKRIIQMDAEANRLHFENAKAKAKWHEALMKDRLANQNKFQKTIRFGAEIINTARAIITSSDLSGVLRQGGFIALGHPVRALQSFPAMLRAFASESKQHAVNQEIMARKNYPLYQQGKLYLSEHGQKLSQMEEAYMSRWAEKIPLVAGSQRAYTTFLNKLRADSFDAMADTLAIGKELTPEEVKAIANYINVATGRGSIGMRDNNMVGLNTAFFAPRYVASRFQLILGTPLYRGTARTRITVAKEYARYLAGIGVVYGLGKLAGASIETDPRSADFGKMKWGNTRLDPLSGLAQVTVLLSRLFTGQTKDARGHIIPIRGEHIPYGGSNAADVIARFLRSKLSPAVGTIVNVLTGKDVVGQPVTLESTAKNLLVPLSFSDIYQAMKDRGVPAGAALGLLSIFGMGLQTYKPK